MPDLDVTDILGDPDIGGEPISIIRALRNVDIHGITVDAPYQIATYGNVQPASGEQLRQLPEEQRDEATISVFVPVMLIPLSRSNAPDLVVYDNQTYRVMIANNFGHYGQGYWHGICQLTDTVLDETA